MAHSVPIDTREITVTPIFKHITVEDVPASEREGRAVMKTVEAVEVRFAGSKLYSPVFPVDAFWKRDGHRVVTYAERWADQYREFLAGRPQEAAGTPLEFLRPYGISDAQLSLCRALKIYSIEALHHLEGPNLKSLQMHANALKEMAARFTADRRGSADLADEVERLKAELAALKGASLPASDPSPAEILDLAGDVAIDIARSHDWQALTVIHTITGNGSDTRFPLPEDYGRMLAASGVIDPATWFWGYLHIPTVMEWLAEESHGFARITPGAWIILEDKFTFVPAPGHEAEARFPYISRNIVKPAAGTKKASFTADTDSFVLDERLLTLGTLWRWKEQKGLEYAEDMRNYEIALSQAQARDAGGRTIRARAGRSLRGTTTGWPWPLGGGA